MSTTEKVFMFLKTFDMVEKVKTDKQMLNEVKKIAPDIEDFLYERNIDEHLPVQLDFLGAGI